MIGKVFAQGGTTINPNDLPGSKLENIDQVLTVGFNVFLIAITLVAFFSLIYSGFLYMSAGGDAAQALKARKNIMWALLSIILALSSYMIIRAVGQLSGATA